MVALDASILQAIKTNGLLKEGHYAYRSGQHSACLIDRDQLLTEPEFASHLGYAIAKRFFTDHVDTVATPSIWGAGVAQWVAYFLEPRARIVHATPIDGQPTVAPVLEELINGKRVLLCDNLVMTGNTITRSCRRSAISAATSLAWPRSGHPAPTRSTVIPSLACSTPSTTRACRPNCALCAAGEPVESVPY